jgi:xanthine dehydrogenase accessory factor
LAPNLSAIITDVVDYEPGSDVVVMTRGHATDLPVLVEVLKKGKFSYLGCIGSEVKALRIRQELKELGFLNDQIKQVHCPMGVMLGDNSPQAIAISIAAQLLQNRKDLRKSEWLAVSGPNLSQQKE